MDQTHRQILKLWAQKVQSKISFNTLSDLNVALQQHEILYHVQAEEVQHLAENVSNEEAIVYLVNHMCTCGSKAFDIFCTALKCIDQTDLCNELTEICQQNDRNFNCVEMNLPIPDAYCVTSDPRGHILIINNTFSNNKGNEREGSEKDVARLQQVFQDLHYEAHVCIDLTKEEMIGEIKDFVEREYHLNCGAAGLIIMSHGSFNGFLDNNNQPVHENDLLRPLKSDYSNLLNKPVFVLMYACRGSQIMNSVIDLSKVLCDSTMESNMAPKGDRMLRIEPMKNLQDIIIVYSCLPTFMCARDREIGTFFIQAFCEVLREHGATMSFSDLCTLVSVKDSKYQLWYQLKYQKFSAVVPQVVSFLKKKFYLSTKYF